MLDAPKAIEHVSPLASEVIKYSNLLLIGFKVDLDDLPVNVVHGIEYFSMRRRAKEEEERFKALARVLGAK